LLKIRHTTALANCWWQPLVRLRWPSREREGNLKARGSPLGEDAGRHGSEPAAAFVEADGLQGRRRAYLEETGLKAASEEEATSRAASCWADAGSAAGRSKL
jgi:hypothetical protein